VATDLSEASDLALWHAWRRAAGRDDCELHVVHVIEEPATLGEAARLEERRRRHDEAQQEVYAHVLKRATGWELAPLHRPLTVHVRLGRPDRAILQLAADVDADLLVVGSHGKSGLQQMFGSVSRKLLSAARLPLLVARPKQLDEMRSSAQLEPVCMDCLRARAASEGARWWCELHGRDHVDVHGAASSRRRDFAKPSADSGSMYAR